MILVRLALTLALLFIAALLSALVTIVSMFSPESISWIIYLFSLVSYWWNWTIGIIQDLAATTPPWMQLLGLGGMFVVGLMAADATADSTEWWAHGENPFWRMAASAAIVNGEKAETSERAFTEFMSAHWLMSAPIGLILAIPRIIWMPIWVLLRVAGDPATHRLALSCLIGPTLIALIWWQAFDLWRTEDRGTPSDSGWSWLTSGWIEKRGTPAAERQRIAWVSGLTIVSMWVGFWIVLPRFGPSKVPYIAPERNLAIWLAGTARTPEALLSAVTGGTFAGLVLAGVLVDGGAYRQQEALSELPPPTDTSLLSSLGNIATPEDSTNDEEEADDEKVTRAKRAARVGNGPADPEATLMASIFACLCATMALTMVHDSMAPSGRPV
jgi:hypothetical protein